MEEYEPSAEEYMAAAMADVEHEGVSDLAVWCARQIAKTAEDFYWAIQASIHLQEVNQ